jgi:hypothetical protein
MAAFGNGYRTRAEFPLAMFPLAFARFYRKRPMRQPGQKAMTFFMLRGGAWRATHSFCSNRQDHAPCASLGIQ